MKNTSGFSLIECMIYCVITMLIVMVWFNGTSLFTRLCTNCGYQINSMTIAYSALDVFARDIRKAPQALAQWPIHTNTALIFSLNETEYVGWSYLHNQLIRYHGTYDSVKNEWVKKTKSLVLDAIEQCSFAFNYGDQDMVSLNIIMNVYGKTVNRTSYW